LPAEFQTTTFPVANRTPEYTLRICRIFTEIAGLLLFKRTYRLEPGKST
jgi:hypothetical protein